MPSQSGSSSGTTNVPGPDRGWIARQLCAVAGAFGARQTDTALVGEQFADCADAAAAEMVNVVQRTFTLFQAKQIFRGGNQIFLGQNAGVAAFDAKLLVDFVTAYATQIITLRVKEQAFDERASVRGRRRIPRPEAAINIFQRLFLDRKSVV